ncbi:bleomycin resistance protein [Pseudoroseomonas sp. WGS1072]|uniref:bleomycin resistance protein n=1 Tax=Roseomonas sp. WGS1072 TaxID=3366816 RepID=UPI003BF1F8BA
MTEMATPNLPSRDFTATARFFARLGFRETWRDAGWMILRRGGLVLEFFLQPELDPARSGFGCCLRLQDAEAFFQAACAAGVPEADTGWPRAHRPRREAWGGTVGALVDPDGTLFRLVQEPG